MRERVMSQQTFQPKKRKLELRCACGSCLGCRKRERVKINTAAYRERRKAFLSMRWSEYIGSRKQETTILSPFALGYTGVAFLALEMLLVNAGKEFRRVYLSEVNRPK